MNEKLKNVIIDEYKDRFPAKSFEPGKTWVPVSGKIFDEQEIINAIEAVLAGWWTEGEFCQKFEEELAKFVGRRFCASVNSGSSANLVAFSALTSFRLPEEKRLKKGDEVITVAAGFPTTINPIIQNGMIPVFVDVDLGTYNVNIENLKKAITKKTKAIFIAHALGNPYRLDVIADVCKKHGLWLIEDSCDALGAKYDGKNIGTFGHISTFSFYPAHHITTAEGGAVLTDDPLLYKIIKSFRDWGRDCWCPTGKDDTCKNRFGWKLGKLPLGYDHKYIYSEIGYNLKMTDMQGAIGLAQLQKLDKFSKIRQDNFSYLFGAFKKYEKYFILPEWEDAAEPSWFGFLLTVRKESGFERDGLLRFLNDKKIGTRLLFAGNITKQPYFINYKVKHKIIGGLKNADEIMNNTFWIGVYPGIDKKMLDYVLKCFAEFMEGNI